MKFKEVVQSILYWFVECKDGGDFRPWCWLGFPVKEPTRKNIQEHFSRKGLNTSFEKNYTNNDPAKAVAFSFDQAEIQLLQSTEKAFACRHKTRLQSYNDDRCLKMFYTKDAIISANAKLETFKNRPKEGNSV